jgi:glycosyltransferase involved in cell wall biosynthesis
MKKKLSIVIPTHGQTFLDEVLTSIVSCYGFNNTIEVVIAENPAKTTEVANIVARYNHLNNIIHIESPLGANKARNTGIRASSGEIVGLIDDDCILDPSWINSMLSCHMIYPNIGIVGGCMKLTFRHTKPRWVDGVFWSMLAGVDHGEGVIDYSYIKDRYAGIIVSGNLSFKRHIFDQTNGFDEGVGYVGKDQLMAGDEITLIRECSELGNPNKIYAGTAVVFHQIPKERTELSYFMKRAYGDGYNFIKTVCTDSINDDLTEEDIIVLHVLPRYHQYLSIPEIGTLRSQVAHEESIRIYINNVIKCKMEYFRGIYDYFAEHKRPKHLDKKFDLFSNTSGVIFNV